MKKYLFFLLIIVLLIATTCGYVYFRANNDNNKKLPAPMIPVTTHPVIQKDVTIQTSAVGTVQAFSTVAIKSRVDGQLLTVNFKEGDTVHTGDILFTIDPKSYQIALQQTQAKLLSDQAQLDNARLILQRNASLAQKGYISSQAYDQLKANVDSYEGNVAADKAAIAAAQLQLAYCTIVSPIDGRTGNLLVYPGNLVKATDNNPLVTINQIKPIYVVFSIPEQRLATIKHELATGPVAITVTADKKNQPAITGSLTFIDNTVDPTTGTIALKATFTNNDEHLWPGQFVTAHIPLRSITKALVIPTQAVQIDQQNNPYVFVVTNDMQVVVRPIKTKSSVTAETIVTEGLTLGEQVVTSGQLHLVNGAKVKIMNSL